VFLAVEIYLGWSLLAIFCEALIAACISSIAAELAEVTRVLISLLIASKVA
jgi:hypothetical protein